MKRYIYSLSMPPGCSLRQRLARVITALLLILYTGTDNMVRSSAAYLLTVAAAALVSGVSAGLAEARAALAKRQTSGRPNHVQNWANDYADVDFQLGDNGSFTVTWDDGFAGNFVVGRGYQPARDM